jgi:parallel beta-helix repeat protein
MAPKGYDRKMRKRPRGRREGEDAEGGHPRSRPVACLMVLGLTTVLLGLEGSAASAQPLTCGQVITEDTTLRGDLGPCPGDGLVIGAANVTLDLNGHAIVGDTGALGRDVGVRNGEGYDGTVIENGEIREFFTSIQLDHADHSRVSDITETSSSRCCNRHFVKVLNSRGTRIEDNVLSDSAALTAEDVFIVSGSHNTIQNNAARGPSEGYGFIVSGSHNSISENFTDYSAFGVSIDGSRNRVTHNSVGSNNGSLGVRGARNLIAANSVNADQGLEASGPGNDIRNNIVGGSEGVDLAVSDCRNVRVDGNVLRNELRLTGCRNARVDDNTVSSAFNSSGIVLVGGSGNSIEQNTTSETAYSGIFVGGGSVGTVVKGNLATGAGFSPYGGGDPESDGIRVEDPGTIVADNRANRNADLGIEAVPGVIDGGGNTAFGNGNPLQCLNVVCN